MPTVVTTFDALRNALENTDETYVYFGADIYGDNQGIKIPNTKTEVTIDGTYGGQRYKYRDFGNETNGLGLPDYTIRVANPAGETFRITMQNMLIDSINYYGPMTASNSANDANISLIMRNVEYYGPQTAYNRYGCMEYYDSTFTITNQYYYSEEFAECSRKRGHALHHNQSGRQCNNRHRKQPLRRRQHSHYHRRRRFAQHHHNKIPLRIGLAIRFPVHSRKKRRFQLHSNRKGQYALHAVLQRRVHRIGGCKRLYGSAVRQLQRAD